MISVDALYSAFLNKMLEDEWVNWTEEEMEYDWYELYLGAAEQFKFPRVDISIDRENQVFMSEDITNSEIQILATYMKCMWLDRTILTWENVKPLYVERDFSQANLIGKLKDLLEHEEKKARRLESIYYRSIQSKPFEYGQMAGEYNWN